jgi:anti-sigma factor RsiW
MTCREFAEILIDFLTGELDEERRRNSEQHLDICPPCVAYLETYRLTIHLSRRLPQDALPPACEQKLRAALAGVIAETKTADGRPGSAQADIA